MKTKTTLQILSAAAALLVAGCDPFPQAPGGPLQLVRASGLSPSSGAYADTSTFSNGAGTVAGVAPDAVMFVQFNVPLDGRSIQATPNYNATFDPVAIGVACAMGGSPLTFSTNWPAGSLVCYYPSSATDGGQIYLEPGAPLLLAVGAYTVSGTVRSGTGSTAAINVGFNVTTAVTAADVSDTSVVPALYEIDLSWAGYASTATTYQVERAPDVAGAAGAYAPIATGVAEPAYQDTTVAAGTTYWYRVSTEAPAAAFTYPVATATTAAAP